MSTHTYDERMRGLDEAVAAVADALRPLLAASGFIGDSTILEHLDTDLQVAVSFSGIELNFPAPAEPLGGSVELPLHTEPTTVALIARALRTELMLRARVLPGDLVNSEVWGPNRFQVIAVNLTEQMAAVQIPNSERGMWLDFDDLTVVHRDLSALVKGLPDPARPETTSE